MATEDALLFIDANKYLDLYRVAEGKPILDYLVEQASHVFVTQRVVDEVKRQKIKAAATFLGGLGEMKLQQGFSVPDHLFGNTEQQTKSITKKQKEIHAKIGEVNNEVKKLTMNIMEKVSQSTDEVSMALGPIFEKAIPHSALELQKAQERRERGMPPGKRSNPIGDELHWEQILGQLAGRQKPQKLWIITKDNDYGTMFAGKGFLNQSLYEELVSVSSGAEAFLFDDIANGIKDYVSVTGVTAHKEPTTAQIKKFNGASNRLPPLDWFTTDGNAAVIQEMIRFRQAALAASNANAYFLDAAQGGGGSLVVSGPPPSICDPEPSAEP